MVGRFISERRARPDLRWCDVRHGSIADQRRNAEARKAGREIKRPQGAGGIAVAPVASFSKVFQWLNVNLIGVGVSCSRRK
jgi:hypothetical protein